MEEDPPVSPWSLVMTYPTGVITAIRTARAEAGTYNK